MSATGAGHGLDMVETGAMEDGRAMCTVNWRDGEDTERFEARVGRVGYERMRFSVTDGGMSERVGALTECA